MQMACFRNEICIIFCDRSVCFIRVVEQNSVHEELIL